MAIGNIVLRKYEKNNDLKIEKKEKEKILISPLLKVWFIILFCFCASFPSYLILNIFIKYIIFLNSMIFYFIFSITLTLLPGYIFYYKQINKELIKYKDIKKNINKNNKDSKNIINKKAINPISYFSPIYIVVIILSIGIYNASTGFAMGLGSALSAVHNESEPIETVINRHLVYADSWIIIINLLYMIFETLIGYIVVNVYEIKNKVKFDKKLKAKIILDALRNSIMFIYIFIYIYITLTLIAISFLFIIFTTFFTLIGSISLLCIISYIYYIYKINKEIKKLHEKIKFENKESENKKAKKLK